MTPTVHAALSNARRKVGMQEVFAHLRLVGPVVVCDRLVEVPGTRRTYPMWLQCVRVAALVVLATTFWYAFTVE
jgi:hypothetical protein